jgi:hypothetical protein
MSAAGGVAALRHPHKFRQPKIFAVQKKPKNEFSHPSGVVDFTLISSSRCQCHLLVAGMFKGGNHGSSQ